MADQSGLSSRAIIGRFFSLLQASAGRSWVPKISMLFSSDQDAETYKWLGFPPQLREYIGGRHAKGLRENGITITNKDFEATIDIAAKDLRRDKTGQIDIRLGELADRGVSHWAKLLSELRVNAAATACYDGQYFYSASHSEGDSGTQTNLLTGSDYSELSAVSVPANPTAAEMVNVILKLIQHMLSYKDDRAEPMNEMALEFLLTVPVNMWGAALQAVTANMLTNTNGAFDNVVGKQQAFKVSVAADARLTTTTELYLDRLDARGKPFIRQAENLNGAAVGGQVMLDDTFGIKSQFLGPESEHCFKTNNCLFGIDASRNVGLGYWQYSIKATLS